MLTRAKERTGAAPSFSIVRHLHPLDQFRLTLSNGYTCICVNSRGYSRKASSTSSKLQASQANVWEEKPVSYSFQHPWFSQWPFLHYSEGMMLLRPAHNVYLPSSRGRFLSKIQIQHLLFKLLCNTILTVTGCNYIERHNLTHPLGLTTSKLLPTALSRKGPGNETSHTQARYRSLSNLA